MELSHEALQRASRDHLLMHFTQHAPFVNRDTELLVLDRGEGVYVYDTRGRQYLDGLSSLFCAQIGYSYGDEMARAAGDQLRRLAFNTNWSTAHPAAIELAERLGSLAPDGLSRAFFTSGGAESVEAAWKLARLYHVANGEPDRLKAIARNTAYHGATLGALALTDVERLVAPFGRPAIPVRHVSNTKAFRRKESDAMLRRALIDELEDAILAEGPETISMVIAEPVQNAGGCLTPPEGYWRELRALCDRYGILLVADEVITGCGRLGEWFGVVRYGATPDLVTLAKGMTSAYAPMGAVLVADSVAAPLLERGRTLQHGITFGGHPLAAAIALRNIDIFDRDGVLENVRANEAYLQARLEDLRALTVVGDVRGAGYFWAVELVRDADDRPLHAAERDWMVRDYLPRRLLDARLIARVDDRGDPVVHVAPPLIADRDTLDVMVDRIGEVLIDVERQVAPRGAREGRMADFGDKATSAPRQDL